MLRLNGVSKKNNKLLLREQSPGKWYTCKKHGPICVVQSVHFSTPGSPGEKTIFHGTTNNSVFAMCDNGGRKQQVTKKCDAFQGKDYETKKWGVLREIFRFYRKCSSFKTKNCKSSLRNINPSTWPSSRHPTVEKVFGHPKRCQKQASQELFGCLGNCAWISAESWLSREAQWCMAFMICLRITVNIYIYNYYNYIYCVYMYSVDI